MDIFTIGTGIFVKNTLETGSHFVFIFYDINNNLQFSLFKKENKEKKTIFKVQVVMTLTSLHEFKCHKVVKCKFLLKVTFGKV